MTDKRLTRDTYLVALTSDPDATIEVEVRPGDQFRAELEAKKWAVPAMTDAKLTNVALWLYCALKRQTGYQGNWPTFRDEDLYAWEPLRDEGGEPVSTPVDPTEEPSGSASPSQDASPASTSTGSTPISTNA